MSAGFHTLEISDVRRETDDAVSLTLSVPERLRDLFRFTPGQHVTLRTAIAGDEVRRNYSICSAAHDDEFRIAIKRIEGGLFSNWAGDALLSGQSIDVMPPHGSFTWTFEAARRASYAAFAAGSGITPILSLLKTGLAIEPESQFTLLYGNRTSASIMFREELFALKDRYLDRLQVYHFLSGEADDVELFNGRLDGPRVAAALGALVEPASIDAAFICGPAAMMEAAAQALLASGVAQEKILVERFTVGRPSEAEAAAAQALAKEAEGRHVEITLDGRRRRIAFRAEKGSILENARAAGLTAPFACQAGVCATCRARLKSGEVRMKANYGLTEAELAQGYILTCQAVPLTDDVVIDYDA